MGVFMKVEEDNFSQFNYFRTVNQEVKNNFQNYLEIEAAGFRPVCTFKMGNCCLPCTLRWMN